MFTRSFPAWSANRKLLPDGRRRFSAFHMPGEMFGFKADALHHASAEAVVPVKVVAYKWEGVLGADGQSASFGHELLSLTVLGLRHAQDHLLLLGRKNALERLAEFLMEMSTPWRERRPRSGHAAAGHRRLSRADAGDRLAHVRRAPANGYISLKLARRVRLLDTAKLKAMRDGHA